MSEGTPRPERALSYTIYEGFSDRELEREGVATLERAMEDLWNRAGGGRKKLRVIDIEVYGSNPIDMFHVIATDH